MPWNQVPKQFAAGTLQSGSGQTVTRRSQATAIMLSEKRAAMHGKNDYAAAAMPKRNHPGGNLGKFLHPSRKPR